MPDVEATLNIGTSINIKPGLISADYWLLYAGMPSPEVFSIVIEKRMGSRAVAYNLFYPIGIGGFEVVDGYATVAHVDAHSIRIAYKVSP